LTNKKQILEMTINRVDRYTEAINSKSAFIIAFNTFVLGTIVIKYSDILALFINSLIKNVVYVLIVALFVGVGASLIFCFLAVKPYLKSGNSTGEYVSMIFFKSISSMKIETYKNQIQNLDDDIIINDLCHQNHVLSLGLSNKYKQIQRSIFCIFFLELLPMICMAFLKCVDWILT
jgi:hypothetical protein